MNRRRPRFAEKRTLYRRALEGSERVLGKEDPQTLTCLNNLAGCMRALGDAAGALPLYRRVQIVCRRVLRSSGLDTSPDNKPRARSASIS